MAAEAPSAIERLRRRARPLLVAFPAAGLALGFVARQAGTDWADAIWTVATLPVLAALVAEIVIGLRRGNLGLDIVAALSMTAALLIGEALAAAVVALMYAGGQYLESFAERRARREMTALLARVPRTAIRHRDSVLEEVDLAAIVPGDRLLVRQGEIVPVDGKVADRTAVLDQSALTGESVPVQRAAGEAVMSGSTNAGEAFDFVATHPAAESTYAAIVRLVEAAQASKAPMSRLADRYALAFLAVTLLIAGGAWLLSGEPVRAVAVLVIATPCPLILAVPVALVSGLSRAARHGILIKSAGALERLARVRTVIFDKTGTLTEGRARLVATEPVADVSAAEVLRLAASLDQASKHVIAESILGEARQAGLRLSTPSEVAETPGEGIEGVVDGRRVIVGGADFVAAKLAAAGVRPRRSIAPGVVTVAVAMDGRLAGTLVIADRLREGMGELLDGLRREGIERIVLATGDREAVASAIAAGLPIDSIRADLTPDRKIGVVLAERKDGPVMMIGDGVNDAPALAAADVGVAMGARGAAAAAEAADVVLLVDRLDPVRPALAIARRTRLIALQSVYVGVGLSVAGMFIAAFGYLTPVQGALIQEVIDVAVIINALRALGQAGPPHAVAPGGRSPLDGQAAEKRAIES